jgi:nascent polypeptide-associated complex subunit alpha
MGRRSGRVSSRSLSRMMKQMGIEQSEVAGVNEVIFRFGDKEWVLDDPQVIMVKQSGTESFQVSGIRSERTITRGEASDTEEEPVREIDIPIEDAALVASQAGVGIEVAIQALKDSGGDLAAAILKLRHK